MIDLVLWRTTRLLCRTLDIDAVFVSAGQKICVEPTLLLMSLNNVRNYRRI
jgi:hypothetical protein